MKAVVVEVKKNKAVVLNDDGSFQKIRGSYEVGQTIECDDKIVPFTHLSKRRIIMRTAAAFAVVVIASGLYYNVAYAASTVVVSDANSSITISLNRLGRVLKVESDDTGENDVVDLLYDSGIKFSNISDALQIVSTTIGDEDDEIENVEVTIDAASASTYEKLCEDVKNAGFKVANSEEELPDTDDAKANDENIPDEMPEEMPEDFADGKSEDEISDDAFGQQDDEARPEAPDDESSEEWDENDSKYGENKGFNEGDEYMEPPEGEEDSMKQPPVMRN